MPKSSLISEARSAQVSEVAESGDAGICARGLIGADTRRTQSFSWAGIPRFHHPRKIFAVWQPDPQAAAQKAQDGQTGGVANE